MVGKEVAKLKILKKKKKEGNLPYDCTALINIRFFDGGDDDDDGDGGDQNRNRFWKIK